MKCKSMNASWHFRVTRFPAWYLLFVYLARTGTDFVHAQNRVASHASSAIREKHADSKFAP